MASDQQREMVRLELKAMASVLGPGWHPDDDATDFVEVGTGKRALTDAQAARVNSLTAEAFELFGSDVYDICLSVQLPMIDSQKKPE